MGGKHFFPEKEMDLLKAATLYDLIKMVKDICLPNEWKTRTESDLLIYSITRT